MRRSAWLLLLIFECFDVGAQERVVGYVASWNVPQAIHTGKLTHLNVAFAHIDKDHRVFAESAAAIRKLSALKKSDPRLKVLLSVGGWQAEGFSDAALTDASRHAFADSAAKVLREFSLDGIDVDWEYPGLGTAGIKYRPEDKQNFTSLLQVLRETLDAGKRAGSDHSLLTIAAADREYIENIELHQVTAYLDWINVMSYDFFN